MKRNLSDCFSCKCDIWNSRKENDFWLIMKVMQTAEWRWEKAYLGCNDAFVFLLCYYKDRLVHWISGRTYCWYSTLWPFTVEWRYIVSVYNIQNTRKNSITWCSNQMMLCGRNTTRTHLACALTCTFYSNAFFLLLSFHSFHLCPKETVHPCTPWRFYSPGGSGWCVCD